ncbi:hypothetical protein BDR05DRAFT_991736 [Suillus weaverae]|nr:hypothetical protein BDR05DRAFT_991736 [Suillus weaverae]
MANAGLARTVRDLREQREACEETINGCRGTACQDCPSWSYEPDSLMERRNIGGQFSASIASSRRPSLKIPLESGPERHHRLAIHRRNRPESPASQDLASGVSSRQGSSALGVDVYYSILRIDQAVQMFVLGPRLILSAREYHAHIDLDDPRVTLFITTASKA